MAFAAAVAVNLTATQSSATTTPVTWRIGGLDYDSIAPFDKEAARQRLREWTGSGTSFEPPSFVEDFATLDFEAELDFVQSFHRDLFGQTALGARDFFLGYPLVGQKITGRLVYRTNPNHYVERISSEPDLAGLSNEEIDALVGIGQYDLEGYSLNIGGHTRTFLPNGTFDPTASEEDIRASRSVFLGNNTLFDQDIVAASGVSTTAPVMQNLAYSNFVTALFECGGTQKMNEALAFIENNLDAQDTTGMTFGVVGPDVLPGDARHPQGPWDSADEQRVAGSLFALQLTRYHSLINLDSKPVSTTCDGTLQEFKESAFITSEYVAIGRITSLGGLDIPAASPAAPVPVPAAWGFALSGLLLLGALGRRKQRAERVSH
ncbi:MAG: hypothetical protein V2I43_08590 [Parvularcula sp.]|jgi:hypothetical protein|nr:hypothetical protein [Parvularcula sp.]